MPDNRSFFLGRLVDPATGKVGAQPMLYDPANLTTHGIITGMTGSGKTGLGVDFLEEAALQGIPAIIIDPKGDLTNLLLHFPELRPTDFEPWIDPEAARRENKTLAQLAEETAQKWQQGLDGWGLGPDQIRTLQQSAHFAIYTPGSSAGIPVNILASFAAPDLPWEENREILREKISTMVTALLSLIGFSDIDPLRSREHILLSNIIENAWSTGRSLDLTELILETQKPPFDRLGAFPLDNFYPEKDRFSLAMLLNNFLASPSFQTWLEGQVLDVSSILFGPDGKPRHNVFYLAHLSETERMFFVTLLFAAVESWMRAQRGTGALRMLVYFDEIMGYLPPVANPPSRTVMLRMLKQARAFGVGLLLATQNPVDVDYKALSNAGTWLIGRLQTEQDKQRLMDGLKSASGSADLGSIDKMISGLGKRVFLLHSVYQSAPVQFNTRWTLNYLAGPLTRSQIPDANALVGAAPAATKAAPVEQSPVQAARTVSAAKPAAAVSTQAQSAPAEGTVTRPVVPSGISEIFLPVELGVREAVAAFRPGPVQDVQAKAVIYQPALFAQSEVRYLQRKYNVDFSQKTACLVTDSENGRIDWENEVVHAYENRQLQSEPQPQARFGSLPGWMSDAKRLASLKKDFEDWLYQSSGLTVRANEELNVFAGPDVSQGDFRDQCSKAARTAMLEEQEKVKNTYRQKIATAQQKAKKAEMEVEELKDDLNARRMEELGTGLSTVIGLFGGRKRSLNSSLSKRRMTTKAGNQLEQARKDAENLKEQVDALESEQADALQQVQNKWEKIVEDATEIKLTATRSNIFTDQFGLAWAPYYQVEVAGQTMTVPAYNAQKRAS